MRATDWVVIPSIWWETGPLVALEAFQNGRPVICSDIGGMSEKVDRRRQRPALPRRRPRGPRRGAEAGGGDAGAVGRAARRDPARLRHPRSRRGGDATSTGACSPPAGAAVRDADGAGRCRRRSSVPDRMAAWLSNDVLLVLRQRERRRRRSRLTPASAARWTCTRWTSAGRVARPRPPEGRAPGPRLAVAVDRIASRTRCDSPSTSSTQRRSTSRPSCAPPGTARTRTRATASPTSSPPRPARRRSRR